MPGRSAGPTPPPKPRPSSCGGTARPGPDQPPDPKGGGSPVRTPQLATCFVGVLAVPLLVVGVGAGAAPVTAGARPRPVGPAASFTVSGSLGGVAATSASNAWAVGTTGSNSAAKPMIVRWNGTAWARVPAPAPAGGAYLSG